MQDLPRSDELETALAVSAHADVVADMRAEGLDARLRSSPRGGWTILVHISPSMVAFVETALGPLPSEGERDASWVCRDVRGRLLYQGGSTNDLIRTLTSIPTLTLI